MPTAACGGIGFPGFALGNDARLYFGSTDDRVYAIKSIGALSLSGTSFKAGDLFQSTFELNETVTRRFTAYAAVVLPDGTMLNAVSLDRPLRPVAEDVPGLRAPFSCQVLSVVIPKAAPAGEYEIAVAFFEAGQPIRSRADAMLDTRAAFTIE